MSHQTENIKKEQIKKEPGAKKYNWNENSVKELNSRFELAEERVSKLED